MPAAVTNNPAAVNPAPRPPVANPETGDTPVALGAPGSPIADGKVIPAATDPIKPGDVGPALDDSRTPGNTPDTTPVPGAGESDTSFSGIRKQIDSIGQQITELSGKENLTENERLQIQELSQTRTQLITMLTNLMQQEHDARMAIIRNF